jgi:L-ribulose-5-phosphate 3-epimerase
MDSQPDRRTWLRIASAAALGSAWALAGTTAPGRLGLYLGLDGGPERALARARELGLYSVEIYNDDFSPATADRLAGARHKNGITAVALFSMGPGEMVWDFEQGPETIGLVPRRFRRERVAHLKAASDFARRLGIPMVETHCGFIPENPREPLYRETVEAIRVIAQHCRANGQKFLYHAGQETPITLRRTIRDVGLDNQGVGLDTANPVMYGKGNPVDAVEILGPHLALVNAKDGLFPEDPNRLGREVLIGQGKVDFPRLLSKLKQIDYRGPILIERETSGPQWVEDVKAEKAYLEKLALAAGIR